MEMGLARKFLYLVVGLIVFALAATFAYRFWGIELLRQAMVPSADVARLSAPGDYGKADLWLARPDKPGNPALWAPEGFQPAENPPAAVFFVHPTSFLDRTQWNAPLNDVAANARAELFLRGQASAFNSSGLVWAPRYRQATFGAFLTSKTQAQQALDFAYRDVLAAFDQFLKEAGNRPIILAGHSQGALHLSRLLVDRVAGKPLAKRIVAAYVVGWPVSITADPSLIVDTFDQTNGFTGQPRKGTPMVCTNPLTGKPNDGAPVEANLGGLLPSRDLSSAVLQKNLVPARCDGRGFLMIGNSPPDLGPYVLPGNNYHVFDYSLFWANVRADAERRLKARRKFWPF